MPETPTSVPVIRTRFCEEGTIATISLDRPKKLNAFTPRMLDELEEALIHVRSQRPRVLILRSTSEKVFSVGADINMFAELSATEMWREWTAQGHRVFDLLESLPFPTLAVLHASAFGGGLEVALACDFRIAASHAKLALPETGLGTAPGWGGIARTTVLAGPSRAKQMILRRAPIDAPTALSWGLVNAVCDSRDLESLIDQWIEDLVHSAPIPVALAKAAITSATDTANTHLLERLAGGLSQGTEDLAEGVAAFREKRTPTFIDL